LNLCLNFNKNVLYSIIYKTTTLVDVCEKKQPFEKINDAQI